MFKKTAILLFTAVSFIFASGSIERSRFLDTDFIDIGTKNGIAENVIAQQFMNIPAKTKLLDEILDFKPRKYETYKCQVDDEGGETCPKDVTACTADPAYNSGYSEKRSGVTTLYSDYIMGRQNKKSNVGTVYAPYHGGVLHIFFFWNPTSKGLQGFIYRTTHFNGEMERDCQSTAEYYTSLFLENVHEEKGKIPIALTINGGIFFQTELETKNLYQINGYLSYRDLIKILGIKITGSKAISKTCQAPITSLRYGHFTNIAGLARKQTYSVSMESKGEPKPICPEGFSFSDQKNKCIKRIDYIYYDYKCPANVGETDPNTGKPYPDWQGPKNKGGDCGGAGLSANMECNSENPPSDNCFRNYFFCPFEKERPCFKKPTEERPVVENKKEDYIYAAGIPDTKSNKITSDPVCDNGGVFVKERKQCEIESKAKCPDGFVQSPYEGMCVKKLTERCVQTDENGQCIKKEFENCQGDFVEGEKPSDSSLCFIPKEQKCPEGYMGDFNNKCIKQAVCQDNQILTNEGKCELIYFYTNFSCPAGYENIKPINSSNDCKGLCGSDGCSCNSAIPSADNCRKKVTTKNTNTYEVSEKSPMILHNVTPSAGYNVPNENFSTINVPCNYDNNGSKFGICKDNVNSIVGQDERLCFKKGNGQEFCYNIAGCRFSGQMTSDKITDLFIERDLKTISSKSATGSIKSTCQLNGNVGYSPRNEGITSVSPKLGSQKYVTIKAKGNAKTSNGTWSGFNIATMAIQLSDGLWYTLDAAYNEQGKRISRSVPDFVVGLDRSLFKIEKENEECNVKGEKVKGYCGDEVLLYMPTPDLGVIGVAELDSLDDDKDKSGNSVNLSITINGIKMPLTKSINAIENNPFIVQPVTASSEYSDRLNFWDSYIDGDIGFIEFVREISSVDKNENFVPENKLPYEMANKGFTNIEYSAGNYKLEPWVTGKTETFKKTSAQVMSDWVMPYANGAPINNHLTMPMSKQQFREALCRGSATNPAVYLVDANTRQRVAITAYDELIEAEDIYVGGYTMHWLGSYGITRCRIGGYRQNYGHRLKCKKTTCPDGYTLTTDLDGGGNKVCVKKTTACPAGYFFTGEAGSKACKKTITKGTFFMAPKMSASECANHAKTVNGTVIPYNMLKFNLINNGKSLLSSGATQESCIIRVNYEIDFQANKYAEKIKTYNNNFEYVCSKWSCAGGSCKIGICPTFNTTIGKENKPMEYQGKIIPKDLEGKLSQEACLEQECDANKEHAGVCGLKFQPSTSLSKGVFFQDGKFYQAYCDEKDAVLSDDGATCIVKRCPEGTIKQANGTCKKK